MLATRASLHLAIHSPNRPPTTHPPLDTHSWVRNFLAILYVHLAQQSSSVPKDIYGNTHTVVPNSWDPEMNVNAPAFQDKFGIVVGRSDALFGSDQWKLGIQIIHGTTGPTLAHAPMMVAPVKVILSETSITLTRAFTSMGLDPITVKEIGIYTLAQGFYYMILRDVLPVPITLEHNQVLAVTYCITTWV